MTLKQTVSLWNEAVVFSQLGKYEESIDTFQKIFSQSAKTLYNIGCVNLFLRRYDTAIRSFDAALGQDQFLAVGYFQRAVAKFYLCRYAETDTDFQLTRLHMRGELFIDYKKLGLPFTLYLHQVLHNLAVVQMMLGNESAMHALLRDCASLQSQDTSPIMPQSLSKNKLKLVELPQDNSLFCPSKSLVNNLEKKDFLGKAKVVSCVIEHDTFVGFEGNRKSVSVPGSPVLAHQSTSRSHSPPLPSRPSRPPPRLPRQANNTTESLMSSTEISEHKARPPPLNREANNTTESMMSSTEISEHKARPPPPNREAPRLSSVQRTLTEQSNINR